MLECEVGVIEFSYCFFCKGQVFWTLKKLIRVEFDRFTDMSKTKEIVVTQKVENAVEKL